MERGVTRDLYVGDGGEDRNVAWELLAGLCGLRMDPYHGGDGDGWETQKSEVRPTMHVVKAFESAPSDTTVRSQCLDVARALDPRQAAKALRTPVVSEGEDPGILEAATIFSSLEAADAAGLFAYTNYTLSEKWAEVMARGPHAEVLYGGALDVADAFYMLTKPAANRVPLEKAARILLAMRDAGNAKGAENILNVLQEVKAAYETADQFYCSGGSEEEDGLPRIHESCQDLLRDDSRTQYVAQLRAAYEALTVTPDEAALASLQARAEEVSDSLIRVQATIAAGVSQLEERLTKLEAGKKKAVHGF